MPPPSLSVSNAHVKANPTDLSQLTDGEIISRYLAASEGEDANAWIHELFTRYYERVVTWCLRIAGDRDDACDLAQQIFVRVQRHLASFRGDSSFSTWLYAVARSECLTWVKTRSSPEQSSDELVLQLEDERESADALIDRTRSVAMVRALLERELDATEFQVFTLHYGDELPLDAITRLLQLENRSGAKAYIVSARRKLARAVQRVKAQESRVHA